MSRRLVGDDVRAAARKLVDFAGGAQLVADIAARGYEGEIDWVELVGCVPDQTVQLAIRIEAQQAARNHALEAS